MRPPLLMLLLTALLMTALLGPVLVALWLAPAMVPLALVTGGLTSLLLLPDRFW